MKTNSLGSACLYNKSKDALSNLDHVISSYRWMTMQTDMLHPKAIDF